MRTTFLGVLSIAVVLALTGCSTELSAGLPSVAQTVPLQNWTKALASRGSRPARWVAIGDSITEGQGASARPKRWLDLARAALRVDYPVTDAPGGVGYLPAVFAVYAPDSRWGEWLSTSRGSVTANFETASLGYRSVVVGDRATISYPFFGSDLDIWWAVGGGRFSYSIDDGAEKSVDTSARATAGRVAPDADITALSGLPDAEHTVTIRANGAVTLEGFTAYSGDRTRGITTFDSAHSGATVDTYLKDLPTFLAALKSASPNLISVSLGGNDASTESPAELKHKYLKLITALKKLPSRPSILLIGEFEPGPAMTNNIRAPWAQYQAAISDLAHSTGSALLSLYREMPAADTSGTGFYSKDGLHPNDSGQKEIARLVLAAIG